MPEKIGLEAVLEDKNFRKGLKNYIDGIDKMEEGNKDMSDAAKKSGKSLDDMSGKMEKGGRSALDLAAQMVVVSQAMGVVKDLAGKGLELAKLGATAERVEDRFAKFAAEAGGATEMLEAFQKGAGGAASEMDAMLASSKLLQMGLVTNADEMETTVELATRLGDQTASVTSRVEDFALMLANQSIPRLDNFGISSGQVRARITELMGSVEGMTRETAFMQATMEAGGESLAILGARTKDTAMTFEIMEARMADAKVELGKKFAPVAGAVFDLLGGLGDEVFMVGAAFGEFGGALVQAGPLLNAMMPALKGLMPAIKGLPGALKAMNLGLNKSTLLLGGMAAAIPLLIIGVVEINKAIKDYKAKMDAAREAASKWREEIEAEIQSGAVYKDIILARVAAIQEEIRVEEKRLEFMQKRLGLDDKLIADLDKLTEKNSVLKIKLDEMKAAWIGEARSLEEANEAIRIHNSGIEGTVGLIPELTEEAWANVEAFRAWVGPMEALNIAIWDMTEAMLDGELATYGFGQSIDAQMGSFREAEQAMGNVETNMQRLTRLTQENKDETDRQAQAVKDAAAADEVAAGKLRELADAHEAAKQAAFNHAEGLLSLAERLSNAEDSEALLRASLEKLAQMQDANQISTQQYLEMYENLQAEFGFTTEKGVFLKDGIQELGDALAQGKIAPEDYGEAVKELNVMALQGVTDVGEFKEALKEYAPPAEIATTNTEAMTGAVGLFGEAGDTSAGLAAILTEKTDLLGASAGNTVGPLGDEAESIDGVAESALEAQDPIDELLARFELLPQQILDLAPEMNKAGQSLVGAFRVGFEKAFEALEAEKVKRLRIFREEFHSSRDPKDKTSPLMGFYEAGQALVNTYMEGLESKWPELGRTLDDMFQFGRAFGGLGGIAGGILNKQIREMKDETKGIDAKLLEIFKRVGGKGRPRGGAEIQKGIIDALGGRTHLLVLQQWKHQGSELTAEELRAVEIFQNLMPLMHERYELTQEQIRLQEKLARMEESQTRLRFLEQQVTLLKMITEHGLDAQDILQGLKLGAEASAEEVLDAMVRAMDEVVRQAEERLGIASESKVFRKIGQQTMAGMAMGIQDLASLPVRQSLIASSATASAPALSGGGYVDNSRSVTIQAGGNTITNAAEASHFESRVQRAVVKGMRGV